MKNWKVLVLFGLIAALFVFAGCIAGTTTPEETPTATPTVAPTNTPTPTPVPEFNGKIDNVSFLGTGDNYLNIADSKADATVTGTFTGSLLKAVKVYFVKLQPVEECDACGSACEQPEAGDPIFMGETIFATAQTGVNIGWSVTIPSSKLAALEDGVYKVFAVAEIGVCASCETLETERVYGPCFEVDLTAPKIANESCCEQGCEGIIDKAGPNPDGDWTITIEGFCPVTCAESASRAVSTDDANASLLTVEPTGEGTPDANLTKEGSWTAKVVGKTGDPNDPTYIIDIFDEDGNKVGEIQGKDGDTVEATFDGNTVKFKIHKPMEDCCVDTITITQASANDGEITVNFTEPVLVTSNCGGLGFAVQIKNGDWSDDDTWNLNATEMAQLSVENYSDSWSIYAIGIEAGAGDSFKVKVMNFVDKAGNVTSEDYCSGTFTSGTVDDTPAECE